MARTNNYGRWGYAGGNQPANTIENDHEDLTSDQHYLYWRWSTGINLEANHVSAGLRIRLKCSYAGKIADAAVSLRVPETAPDGETGTERRPIGNSDGTWKEYPFYINTSRWGVKPGEYWYEAYIRNTNGGTFNAPSEARSGEASLYVGNLKNRVTRGYHPWIVEQFTIDPEYHETQDALDWRSSDASPANVDALPALVDSTPAPKTDPLVLPDLEWIYAKVGAGISKIMPEATGGKPPRNYYATDIPAGLDFDPVEREIRGTLTVAGSAYEFTYGVRDATGAITTKEQRLHISDPFGFNGRISDLERRENDGIHTFTIPGIRGNVGAVTYTLGKAARFGGGTLANAYVLGSGVVTVNGSTVEEARLSLTATDGQGSIATLNWNVKTVAAGTPEPETLGAWNFELEDIELYAGDTVVEIAPHFSYNNGTSCVEYLRGLNEGGDEDGDPWTEYSRESVPSWIVLSNASPQVLTVRAPDPEGPGGVTYKLAIYCGNSDGSVETNQYQKFGVVVLNPGLSEDDSADYFFVLYGDGI